MCVELQTIARFPGHSRLAADTAKKDGEALGYFFLHPSSGDLPFPSKVKTGAHVKPREIVTVDHSDAQRMFRLDERQPDPTADARMPRVRVGGSWS